MVSQPDYSDGTVAVRRPSSVTSRASTSRRHHRHGRSQHGSSSYLPQNEFPIFAHTGDVEIVISAGGQEKRYLLHRLILQQCSGFFEAGLSDEWSRSQGQLVSPIVPETGLARIGEETESPSSPSAIISPESMSRRPLPKTRWRYELDWENTEEDEEPLLVQTVSLRFCT